MDHKNYNPRLVEYLTDPQWVGTVAAGDYFALFIRNLDNPALIWEHAFDRQIADESRDLLLTLTTMPTESRLADVEAAFEAFHGQQSAARRRKTFQRALRELDGTFISTRRLGEIVLLQFQNPSIRDFMVRRLLQEPLRQDVLLSSVFFEQARWFAEILFDERRFVRPYVALQYGTLVAAALKRLADARSCTIDVHWYSEGRVPTVQKPDRAMRLGVIAAFARTVGTAGEDEFIRARLLDLEQALQNNQLSPASCLVTIEPLRQLGLLSQPSGIRFVGALKEKASQAGDIEEFKALGQLTELLPEHFGEVELRELSDSFSAFVAQFVEDYESDKLGVDEPDIIQEDSNSATITYVTLGLRRRRGIKPSKYVRIIVGSSTSRNVTMIIRITAACCYKGCGAFLMRKEYIRSSPHRFRGFVTGKGMQGVMPRNAQPLTIRFRP